MTTKEFEVQLALGSLSFNTKLKVAESEKASKRVLTFLSTDENKYVRCWVGHNSNTPIKILKRLSMDNFWIVRANVASNSSTPINILKKLSTDEDSNVRSIVSDHIHRRFPIMKTDDNI